MILSAYGSAAAFSADRINAPKELPTLRQMFGISAEIEVMLKERHVKRDSSIIRANQHAAGGKGGSGSRSRLRLAGPRRTHQWPGRKSPPRRSRAGRSRRRDPSALREPRDAR
jgi:hypothetical protein